MKRLVQPDGSQFSHGDTSGASHACKHQDIRWSPGNVSNPDVRSLFFRFPDGTPVRQFDRGSGRSKDFFSMSS
jgi:hypothetical protein